MFSVGILYLTTQEDISMSIGLANDRGFHLLKQAIMIEKELVAIVKEYCKMNSTGLEKKILHIHRVKQMNHDQRWKLLKKLNKRRQSWKTQ
jgi:hypothetical protein